MKKITRRKKVNLKSKIKGSKERPRISVFRSNMYLYAQIIDDTEGKTLIGVSEKMIKGTLQKGSKPAKDLGILLAKKAIEKSIKKIAFDKGRYAYHGQVKDLAEGLREGGLDF